MISQSGKVKHGFLAATPLGGQKPGIFPYFQFLIADFLFIHYIIRKYPKNRTLVKSKLFQCTSKSLVN